MANTENMIVQTSLLAYFILDASLQVIIAINKKWSETLLLYLTNGYFFNYLLEIFSP